VDVASHRGLLKQLLLLHELLIRRWKLLLLLASTFSTEAAALLESSWQPPPVDLEEAEFTSIPSKDWTAVEWLGRTPWLDGWRFCNLVFTVLMKNNIMVFRLN